MSYPCLLDAVSAKNNNGLSLVTRHPTRILILLRVKETSWLGLNCQALPAPSFHPVEGSTHSAIVRSLLQAHKLFEPARSPTKSSLPAVACGLARG